MSATATLADLTDLAALARDVVDLKRVRDARSPRSLLERAFGRAWGRLVRGDNLDAVAHGETARVLAAVRLAGIDGDVLREHGATPSEAVGVLRRGFDDVAAPLDEALRERLRGTISEETLSVHTTESAEPIFVDVLIRQPRAGATHPGVPRLVLEPAESHGDHCAGVAVLGTLLAPEFGADPARVFLTGLAHHLFNVTLPDAGYAGDVLMGEIGEQIVERAFEHALNDLPDGLLVEVEQALEATRRAAVDTPAGRAFHAADVLDRVLEMEWHARTARFRLADALGTNVEAGQRNIVHAGFEQDFQRDVLAAAGLWPTKGEEQ